MLPSRFGAHRSECWRVVWSVSVNRLSLLAPLRSPLLRDADAALPVQVPGAGQIEHVRTAPLRFGFLALGEPHQLFHIMGPAIELARMGHAVTFLVTSVWHERILARYAAGARFEVRMLRTLPQGRAPKIFRAPPRFFSILLNAPAFQGFDVIVTPERSSTLIKRCGLFTGMLAHIPHGAGDRAAGYDGRIRYFDCVIAAGKKDQERMLARGLVSVDRCVAAGYAKFDVLKSPAPFFADDKPIVLYNPHFDRKLSSWPGIGEALLERFTADHSFNYIIAPHIRMRGAMRRSFERMAAQNTCAHIRFDGGSVHSINMDYTRAASIYLGDVSSQVYEFIRTPRPCVFLNSASVDWRGCEHFTHWRLGDVAENANEAMACLKSAHRKHAHYRPRQDELFNKSISQDDRPASPRIAQALLEQFWAWRVRTLS